MSRLVYVLLTLAVACNAERLSSKRGLPAEELPHGRDKRESKREVIIADQSSNSGRILTPNYPNYYPKNLDFEWVISAPQGETISILMDGFSIESSFKCYRDYLKIYDGADVNADLVGTYCGESNGRLELTSSSNNLYFRFHSNYCTQLYGFILDWAITGQQELPIPRPACPGPLYLTQEGEIASEGYGVRNYLNNENCAWRITAPAGKRIRLEFTEMHLEPSIDCALDNIAFYDGTDQNAPLLARLCGHYLPQSPVSSGNEVTVTFDTSSNWGFPGFHLNFYFID